MLKPLVVVVEDDPVNREYLAEVLGADYDLAMAADGAELGEVLADRGDRVAAILMDLALPGTDGLTLTRRLRSEARWKTVPIFAITAFTETRDLALQAGCDGFLSKPFSRQAILELLTSRRSETRGRTGGEPQGDAG